MKHKYKENSGASPIKDVQLILEKHQHAIEKLYILIRQKERYLKKSSTPIVEEQLSVLYAAIVDIADGLEDYITAYNDLSAEYIFSTHEVMALRYALPAKRSHLCKSRELYALRYLIHHKRLPPRRMPDSIREKVDRFERRIAQEEKVVQNG